MERDLYTLKPPTRWVGSRLDVHEVLDSTNREAERLAAAGAPEGTLVIADRQTAGRGRLGRSFFSPPGGGLYLSLLLRPEGPVDRVHENIFAAAVAVAEAVRAHVPSVPLEIKWPNDVLLDRRKTSGINLPAQIEGTRVASAILGIGVNVNTRASEFPEELQSIATSLRIAGGQTLDRTAFAEDLLGRLEQWIDKLRGDGFDAVLDCWRRYFRMKGASVRVGGPGVSEEIEGTVEGVAPDGALLLDVVRAGEVCRERILAGDVTLLGSMRPSEV
ncbi:MAG: biotin--[acetyl-CoA-carboxylase] ligase [Deltaproteobacteria bacterium]|nr:biotin--[acetyl-CoA-carboxylase] ligase [Deltaproteobacteria bacterium]MBW2414375.1 biotin--[acetyl-CoA-carboxylase] ligase [Deltaproteobacteria bacterium]